MISNTLQDLLLGIVPDTDTLSGMFGAYQQHELDSADRALDVIMKSMSIDHDDWHKKNTGDCPGPMYFGLRALKGYLLSHAENLTDEEALGIYTMCIFNFAENFYHEDDMKDKRKKVEGLAKLAQTLGIDVPPHIKDQMKKAGLDIEDATVVTQDNVVDRMRGVVESDRTKSVIKDIQSGKITIPDQSLEAMKERVDEKGIYERIAANGGDLPEKDFLDLIGVDENASSREKLVAAVSALAHIPLPDNAPEDVKRQLKELQDELRNQMDKPE